MNNPQNTIINNVNTSTVVLIKSTVLVLVWNKQQKLKTFSVKNLVDDNTLFWSLIILLEITSQ
jgi:hypothetical protein